MSLKKSNRLKGTLAFRLTLWYAMIFSLSALVVFLAIFLLIRAVVHKQRDHSLRAELKEFSMIQTAGGLDKLKEGMLWEVGSEGAQNIFLRIISEDGRELATTDLSAWEGLRPGKTCIEKLKLSGADHLFETLRLPKQFYPVRVVSGSIGNGLMLQFGQSLGEDEAFLGILRNVFIPLMAAATLLAALSGWFMAKRALTGVGEVTHAAMDISKGAFERRVAVKHKGIEIDLLATAFNHMLDRIELLIREMKEMNNNIAHDMRSPLARMRGAAEMALTTVTSAEENRAIAASMIEDCDHLMGMINTMLDIAEAESGMAEPKRTMVDIADVIRNACSLFMPVAEDKSIKIESESFEGCYAWADQRMLQRMVGNLLDNALKYTPAGGTITLSALVADDQDDRVTIRIQDSGIGIAEEDIPHIFQKFYRCDRSRAEHGSGLGLSLAKAIATTHGGTIDVVSRVGEGTIFTVSLPRSTGSNGHEGAN